MQYSREIDDTVLIQFMILYTLGKVKEPVRYDTMLNLIMENCNVNYAEFQIALNNLLETKHMECLKDSQDRAIYRLLPKGVTAGEFFASEIPVYIKEPINESIRPILHKAMEKERIRAEIIPVAKNQYSAKCRLQDDDGVSLLELSFFAGDRSEAVKIMQHFKTHPDEVYRKIMEILTDYQ